MTWQLTKQNPYAHEVGPEDILESEYDKPFGERLTKVKCRVCSKHLSEAELCSIRSAFALVRHYDCDCKSVDIYHLMGDDVRNTSSSDRVLEVVKEISIGKMQLYPSMIAFYNGKSIVIKPSYTSRFDEETNDVAAVEIALRRGWLRPHVKPEDKPFAKAVSWLKSLGSKNK